MKISVLLPISNNTFQSYQAINSVLDQTHKNYEILICLNGNNKNFDEKIIEKYKRIKKIKFFKIKEKNIVTALNHLILKANGKYCARIDADDLCKPERFKEQINYIKKKKLDFLSSDCVVNVNGKFSYIHKTVLSKSLYTNPIVHPTIMIKTKVIKLFKYNDVPYAEDYDLYLRLHNAGVRLENLKKNLIIYNKNLKNIKNNNRAFYVTLSTTIIANSFRNKNSVNANFFNKIKVNNTFKRHYKFYLKYFILNKSIYRYVFLMICLVFSCDLIRKSIQSKLWYLFYNNLPIIQKRKNYLIKNNNKYIKLPLVSFIVPTYNSEKTIKRTIQSIKSQTYKNIEIVVVDNSDNNKTINEINKYFKDIKIIQIKNKILPAEARNIAVRNISKKSQFISFCDSDDFLKKNKTEIQIKIMLNEGLDVSCTNMDTYDVNTNVMCSAIFNIPFNFFDEKILFYKNYIVTSSVIISKKLFHSVNGFPVSKFFYSYEDYFFWLRVLKKRKIRFVDQSLLIYQIDLIHSASSRSRSIINQRFRIFIFYFLCMDFKAIVKILIGNFYLFKNWFIRKVMKLKKSDYIDLL